MFRRRNITELCSFQNTNMQYVTGILCYADIFDVIFFKPEHRINILIKEASKVAYNKKEKEKMFIAYVFLDKPRSFNA